jgi:hypothetical protein
MSSDQQRAIVRTAIETGTRTTEDAALGLPRLPFTLDDDGNRDWEDLVVDVYRVDNAIRGTVLANLSEHRRFLDIFLQQFMLTDPPAHTEIRRLLRSAFTPRSPGRADPRSGGRSGSGCRRCRRTPPW